MVAHGALLRIYEKKPLVADQVAVNWRKADITPRQRAMLDFAMKVCERSHEIEEADFARLQPQHAFGDDPQIKPDRQRKAQQAEHDRPDDEGPHRALVSGDPIDQSRHGTSPTLAGPCAPRH